MTGCRKSVLVCHGDVFLTTFTPTLASHTVLRGHTLVPALMSHAAREPVTVSRVLLAVLEHAGKDRNLRRK